MIVARKLLPNLCTCRLRFGLYPVRYFIVAMLGKHRVIQLKRSGLFSVADANQSKIVIDWPEPFFVVFISLIDVIRGQSKNNRRG